MALWLIWSSHEISNAALSAAGYLHGLRLDSHFIILDSTEEAAMLAGRLRKAAPIVNTGYLFVVSMGNQFHGLLQREAWLWLRQHGAIEEVKCSNCENNYRLGLEEGRRTASEQQVEALKSELRRTKQELVATQEANAALKRATTVLKSPAACRRGSFRRITVLPVRHSAVREEEILGRPGDEPYHFCDDPNVGEEIKRVLVSEDRPWEENTFFGKRPNGA